MGFDRLSGALQYQIVNTLGFRQLRPVQDATIDAVLDGEDCVVLAPTAGGKTEAAFFPLLSLMDKHDWKPTSILYLSPIRDLLNNQEDRIAKYAGLLGRRVFKWHGDVSDSLKRGFLKEPADILLTTPESVEAMLLSPRVPSREVFGQVKAVLVDEIHAFADDDRGSHLTSVVERIARRAGSELLRLGLSATVGNPAEILSWLQGSSERPGRVVDASKHAGGVPEPEISIDYVGDIDNAARVIEAIHRGKKRLVFVDSRRGTEELGEKLNRLGVTTHVNHGSLAASQRRDAELAFAQGQNCVIVATSALELGIDVGDLDHVVQIDAPATVSSFLQRMGRTGRRGGPPNCTFLATSDDDLLRAMALVSLWRKGFVEDVAPSQRAAHILAHQVMSLAVESGGIARGEWWPWLEGATPYDGLIPEERREVVQHMLHEKILADFDGRLWLGPRGEKLYGRANFRELYSVFDAPRLIAVMHGNREVGQVDSAFLSSLEDQESLGSFTLGGRNWNVVHIDWRRGKCSVKPWTGGKPARWSGTPRHLSWSVCQEMRSLLLSEDEPEYWSKRARKLMKELRAQYAFLADGDAFVNEGTDKITWYNFAGGAANALLSKLLQFELGGKVISRNTSLSFTQKAGESMVAIKQALKVLLQADRPNRRDALRFAPDITNSRISKFQPCLPDELARDVLIRKVVDLAGARRALGLPALVPDEPTSLQYAQPENPIVWIRSHSELESICEVLRAERHVALDVETTLSDQSLCLLQLGTVDRNYILDPFEVSSLEPLRPVLSNPEISKVIHNAAFEERVLGKLGLELRGVIDTMKLSRQKHKQAGISHSLRAVARRELDLTISKVHQTSSWSTRPLSQGQIEYAALDVELLLKIHRRLLSLS